MRRLAALLLCLMTLALVAGCANLYDDLTYPEARFNPGDQ